MKREPRRYEEPNLTLPPDYRWCTHAEAVALEDLSDEFFEAASDLRDALCDIPRTPALDVANLLRVGRWCAIIGASIRAYGLEINREGAHANLVPAIKAASRRETATGRAEYPQSADDLP